MNISEKLKLLKTMSNEEKMLFYFSLPQQEKKSEEIVTMLIPLDNSIINNLEEPFKISMMIGKLQNGKLFYSLDDIFKKNKIIQEMALKYCVDIYEELKLDNNNFNENLIFVKINHLVFNKIPKDWQEDYEFIVEALRVNLNVWNVLSERVKKDLITDENFMKELVSIDGYFFLNIREQYSNNKEMVINCINSLLLENTNIFNHLSQDDFNKTVNLNNIISDFLKNDKNFIYSLIENEMLEYKYIADNFSDDIELLTYAIEKNCMVYQCLNDELKLNDGLVKTFIAQEGSDLRYIPSDYLDSLEKIRDILAIIEENKDDDIFYGEFLSISLLKDNEDISNFISKNVEMGKCNEAYISVEKLLSKIEKSLMSQDISSTTVKIKKRKF